MNSTALPTRDLRQAVAIGALAGLPVGAVVLTLATAFAKGLSVERIVLSICAGSVGGVVLGSMLAFVVRAPGPAFHGALLGLLFSGVIGVPLAVAVANGRLHRPEFEDGQSPSPMAVWLGTLAVLVLAGAVTGALWWELRDWLRRFQAVPLRKIPEQGRRQLRRVWVRGMYASGIAIGILGVGLLYCASGWELPGLYGSAVACGALLTAELGALARRTSLWVVPPAD
jgi:hypothetical protein